MKWLYCMLVIVTGIIYTTDGVSKWTFQCPCLCDLDDFGRKRIICDESQQSQLSVIPVDAMDKHAQVNKQTIHDHFSRLLDSGPPRDWISSQATKSDTWKNFSKL